MVGDAGGMLARIFNLLGITRDSQRIGNCVQCRPPGDWMDGSPKAPWFYSAIDHCKVYRDPLLAEGHKVVVTLGGTALKTVMGLLDAKKIRVQDWHGSVLRDPTDRFWVVPTFHPSFLQRGAHNLLGAVLWDIEQAKHAILHGKPESDHSLVVDPPLDWFTAWVDCVIAARLQDPEAYPISSDIETPDKAGGQDEGELSAEDRSYQILRVNVSVNPDEGVSVPYIGGYIEQLIRLHQSPGRIWGWNFWGYDFSRCAASGLVREVDFPRVVDLMWLWHRLQSDLPRGLGFVAPFYSSYGPWKHTAESDPGLYGAIDGLQNHRVGFGIMADLHKQGMYDSAMRYTHELMANALRPAQLVGVQIDRPQLLCFKDELAAKATRLLGEIQACVPDELKVLTPKHGLTKRPAENVLHVKASAFTRKGAKRAGKEASEIKLDLYKSATVVDRTVDKDVLVCRACGGAEVHRRHRCADKGLVPDVQLESRGVQRWYWQEPFNPDSPDQVLAYIKYRKHSPGRAKKTGKDSTNKETLKTLTRTGDPFYKELLNYRAVMKVKGTYVDGIERRLDEHDRIHPEPTFVPSTGRLSYVNPNITNVVADKEGKETLAAGFRKVVVPHREQVETSTPGVHAIWPSSHRLLEVDFSGSESVDFGWWQRDPNFIRFAKLGIHAALASHALGRPYNPAWSDSELGAYFKEIKKSKDEHTALTYDRSKRFVHGYSYGLTVPGMVLQFPEIFPTKKVAEEYAARFDALAPKAGPFQRSVRELAFKQHFLGGPGVHPFGFKHWFWSVYTFKKITAGQYWKILSVCRKNGMQESEAPVTIINGQYFKISLGEDGKRVVAFFPQSTTAGKLCDVMLRLFTPELPAYLGTIADGITPLRAPIHDSLLMSIPTRVFELVAETVFREMQRPFVQLPMPAEWGMGEYLSTGVSAKVGKVGASWAELESLDVPKFSEVGVASDRIATAPVDEESEDQEDFVREIA